jgi:uncharacterized membrane-anchored protein YhcB (DUF1043 family)
MADWTTVAVAAVTGLGSGAVASLLTPWSQWGVDKRRQQRAARTKLVDDWRAMVARHLHNGGAQIIDDADYLKLRRHLSPERLKRLELSGRHFTFREGAEGISAHDRLSAVTEEIDRLEREWGLP